MNTTNSTSQPAPLKFFCFSSILRHDKWLTPAYVGVDESGLIQYLSDRAPQEPIAIKVYKVMPFRVFKMHTHMPFNMPWLALLKSCHGH